MARLILIRHGETDYSSESRYCGYSDPPLNKKGIWQVKKLAERLKRLNVDKVYSSDLKRAAKTAKIIFKDKSIEESQDFREINFGIFEGLKYEEIIKKYPKLYRTWLDNPTKVKIPKGEALKDLSKRVRKRLSLILFQHKDGKIVLVTHGGPIRVILCDALKFSLEAFWQIEQDIGALNIIEYSEKSEPRVIKMNDTSHLLIKEKIAL